jgi:hypothetical protein
MSKARQVSKIVNATTVSGTVSTFVSSPIVPTATASNQAINMQQMQDAVATTYLKTDVDAMIDDIITQLEILTGA